MGHSNPPPPVQFKFLADHASIPFFFKWNSPYLRIDLWNHNNQCWNLLKMNKKKRGSQALKIESLSIWFLFSGSNLSKGREMLVLPSTERAALGHLSHFRLSSGHFRCYLSHFWPISGLFRSYLRHFGHIWAISGLFEPFWPFFSLFRSYLAYIGPIWAIFGVFLALSKGHRPPSCEADALTNTGG